MLVTQREPLRAPAAGATATESLCPSRLFPPPDVKAEPRCALAGAAAATRRARCCFTPTGARPAIVTLLVIAAIFYAKSEERACVDARQSLTRSTASTCPVWIKLVSSSLFAQAFHFQRFFYSVSAGPPHRALFPHLPHQRRHRIHPSRAPIQRPSHRRGAQRGHTHHARAATIEIPRVIHLLGV